MPDPTEAVDLLPAESIALTAALAQTLRGDVVPPNTATLCVLALARVTGRHDWTDPDWSKVADHA